MNKTIGLFGITANPPHINHLKAIESAADKLDEVWVSPVYKHPFPKNYVSYDKRLKMLELLLKNTKKKNILIVEADKSFYDEHKSIPYSYDILKFLKEKNSEIDFKLIIGEDNYKFETWSKFKNYKEIESEFGLVIEKDLGFHSTKIREMLKFKNLDLKKFLNEDIIRYILLNNLYVMEK